MFAGEEGSGDRVEVQRGRLRAWESAAAPRSRGWGAEGGRRGGGEPPPEFATESVGLGRFRADRGVREARPAAGAHLCGPPAAARPLARSLARDSLQSPRTLSAVCVWQSCKEKGSAEAARSCSSPSCPPPPTRLPRPSLPAPAAPLRGPARGGSPGRANLEQPAVPSGKKLEAIGTGGASWSRSWSPELARAPRGREQEPAGFAESSRGHGENLPQCLEQGLLRGWRRRAPSATGRLQRLGT